MDHYALMVNQHERHEAVLRLIQKYNPDSRTIIFTQTKVEANNFIKYFDSDDIVILHGDIPQSAREHNMRKFRSGEKKILIATDVAARGIDIPNIELVIQLSPPETSEPYIHRSGRTGRAGKEGMNITFFDESNVEDLVNIEREVKIDIKIINNNFNISLWKQQADILVHEIATSEQSLDDPFYQLFVSEILKKTKPENAILYFLKQKLGKIPQMTSGITNQKGYITYKAFKTGDSPVPLKEICKEIDIFHLTEDSDALTFDILWNDYYHFEQLIDQQSSYEFEMFD